MAETTRGQLEDHIRATSYSDPGFRKALLENPKKAVESQMKGNMGENVEVKVIEETSNVIYLSIPPAPVEAGDELSDEDLQKVAGGFMDENIEECKAQGALAFASHVELSLV